MEFSIERLPIRESQMNISRKAIPNLGAEKGSLHKF